jgi:hypothetical protein
MRTRTLIAGAALLFVGALVSQCSRQQPEAPAAPAADVAAVFSVNELMVNLFDPIADDIFNAVGSEVSDTGGVVDIRPTTDEDWDKVMRAAVTIAEGTNLLKIHPRPAVAEGYTYEPWLRGGEDAPELAPEEVQRRMEAQRGVWDGYADALRTETLKVIDIVKAKDPDKLFQAAYEMNVACEACHLTFWIPGDRQAVELDREKRAQPGTPAP